MQRTTAIPMSNGASPLMADAIVFKKVNPSVNAKRLVILSYFIKYTKEITTDGSNTKNSTPKKVS